MCIQEVLKWLNLSLKYVHDTKLLQYTDKLNELLYRYRKNVRRLEEGLSVPGRVVPMLEGGNYPRTERQPFGQVAPDLVFFCRRVYDFRQKRILKNPCWFCQNEFGKSCEFYFLI